MVALPALTLRRLAVFAACLSATYASSGPITSLVISNKVLAPDGFSRNTVVANGTHPGPLISGHKVRTSRKLGPNTRHS